MTYFIQFCFYKLPMEQLSPSYRKARIGRVAFMENLKPYSPVTSVNVTISFKSFLTFNFNPFATLV